jgi:hypothetical protein
VLSWFCGSISIQESGPVYVKVAVAAPDGVVVPAKFDEAIPLLAPFQTVTWNVPSRTGSALAGVASISGAAISPAATAIFKNADFIIYLPYRGEPINFCLIDRTSNRFNKEKGIFTGNQEI